MGEKGKELEENKGRRKRCKILERTERTGRTNKRIYMKKLLHSVNSYVKIKKINSAKTNVKSKEYEEKQGRDGDKKQTVLHHTQES